MAAADVVAAEHYYYYPFSIRSCVLSKLMLVCGPSSYLGSKSSINPQAQYSTAQKVQGKRRHTGCFHEANNWSAGGSTDAGCYSSCDEIQ